ncbi:MAG: ISLre2 family transposase [Marinospirillum sp.]|uniref:ISLre2 family transposase n=1 Tax=Marinospirillum sp. TaxID=2183934 RepID=UPI001A04A562|nr:ISLre2 family transposase [Marinospirillum sp.]MBE0509061.1 ISLre2 family transposase [Marinospirillum sp.]
MTASTVKLIITAEVAGQRFDLGKVDIQISGKLDEVINQGMQSMGTALYGAILQGVDDGLRETAPTGWQNIGREKRTIMTCVGSVTYKRRVYKDTTGKRRKPVDEVLGIDPYGRYSLGVQQKGSYLASELPYREAADILSWLIRNHVSHSTIGRMIRAVGASLQAEEQDRLEQVFEKGARLEPGRVPAKVLYGESDGVFVPLQREAKKKVEVRVGVMYTGKKVIGVGRKALENKVVVTKIVKNSQEWQETILKTAYEHYDLSKTAQMVVGGDGNSWVKQSFDLLGLPTVFVLDRYHLYRNARRAFGHTHKTETWIRKICEGDLETVLSEMLAVVAKSPPRKADGMKAFIKYLINNRDGLLDPDCRSHLQPGLGNLGGIEGNVDKLVVRRLKGRGRSWRLDGVKAMLAVCRHKEELRLGAFKPFMKSDDGCQPKNTYQKKIDYGEWLQADVPAIHLCHSGRPWAKVLKEIVHPRGVL